jgi:dihydropyrimidinase
MSPPFRNKKHQDSLWNGLMSGSLSVVATDHCAFTTEQKRYGVGDFSKIPTAPGGWRTGCRCSGPTASDRPPDAERVRRVTSTNIAKILNCYPKKGAILVGADADIVVWDPEKIQDDHRRQRSNPPSTTTSSRARRSQGLPRFTLTRGQVAVYDGEIRTAGRPRQVRRAGAQRHGEQGAVDLEGADRADAGGADGHSGDGGMMS